MLVSRFCSGVHHLAPVARERQAKNYAGADLADEMGGTTQALFNLYRDSSHLAIEDPKERALVIAKAVFQKALRYYTFSTNELCTRYLSEVCQILNQFLSKEKQIKVSDFFDE